MNEGRALWWNRVCPRDKLNNSCDGTKFPAPSSPSSTATRAFLLPCLPILLCAGRSSRLAPCPSPWQLRKYLRHARLQTAHINRKKWHLLHAHFPLIFSCTLLLAKEMEILLRHYFPESSVLIFREWRGEGILSYKEEKTQHNKDQLGWNAEPLLQAKVPVSGGTGMGGMVPVSATLREMTINS